MRIVLFLALALQLALPAIAGEPVTAVGVQLGGGASFVYTVDPSQSPMSDKYCSYSISTGGTTVTTKGDPILYVGRVRLGVWPSKHLTYKLAGGLEVTGHAVAANGTVSDLEIYRPDGTMLLITGMSKGLPVFTEKGKIATWLYKQFSRVPTPVLDLTDVK